jgi:phage-related protein
MSLTEEPLPETVASGLVAEIISSTIPQVIPPPTIPPGKSLIGLMPDLFKQFGLTALAASGAVFDWCVTDASYDLEPTIIKAQFGDGYAQRRAAGINTQARKWSLSMKNIDAATSKAVDAFLSARNGVEIFNWTPPRTTTAEDVICPSWNVAYGDLLDDGTRLFSITMKFEDAYV